MKNTVAIIGTGWVGATAAYALMLKDIVSEIHLVDINEKKCEGEALDLSDALSFYATTTIKKSCYEYARNADIIIITAGVPQKPGQSRLELTEINAKIMRSIAQQLNPIKKEAIVLVVANPVDIMTLEALNAFKDYVHNPLQQIFGSGTWLDTQRLRRYLGEHFSINPDSVDAFVLGEHGDSQFVYWSQASIGGTNIEEYGIPQETLDTIALKTKKEAYNIIQTKGATYYGIASCLADICQMIIFDQRRVIPLSVFDTQAQLCLSRPVALCKQGACVDSVRLALNELEKKQWQNSIRSIIKSIPDDSELIVQSKI